MFYGWYVLAITVVAGVIGAGTSQLFMGVMLKPMTAEFGWSRTEVSGAITAGTLSAGLASPFFGRLADRYGPRVLTAAAGLVLAGVFLALSRMDSVWQFYVAYVVGRAVTQNTMGGVVARTAAVNWFRRMRGRAMGLVGMSTPLGGFGLVLVAQAIMDARDWRAVFVTFTGLTVALVAVPAVLVMRRRPEDLGLRPDGDAGPSRGGEAQPGKAAAEEPGWTLREAVRTPALWLLGMGLFLGIMGNGAMSFHQVAYYTDRGISPGAAAVALSLFALSGAVSSLVWGFLVERFSERLLAVGTMLLAAVLMLYLMTVATAAGAVTFSLLFGLAARGESALVMLILAQYYGRSSYGTISGFITPLQMLGLGSGPLVASLFFDLTGAYTIVFIVFSAMFAMSAALLWLARKPLPPVRPPVSTAAAS